MSGDNKFFDFGELYLYPAQGQEPFVTRLHADYRFAYTYAQFWMDRFSIDVAVRNNFSVVIGIQSGFPGEHDERSLFLSGRLPAAIREKLEQIEQMSGFNPDGDYEPEVHPGGSGHGFPHLYLFRHSNAVGTIRCGNGFPSKDLRVFQTYTESEKLLGELHELMENWGEQLRGNFFNPNILVVDEVR